MASSVYLHIPFCKSKCKYCSFVSFTAEEKINDYIPLLINDIKKYYKNETLKTIYFGGGTPSLLSINQVEKVLNCLNFSADTEITFEMNPDDAKPDYLKALKDIGINRISMGSQTFDDNVLKLIGRRHSANDTREAVKNAKNAGFKNINLDLIYGLPDADIDKDINEILKLEIQHISTYGLKIEEGSYFYKHLPQNLPDDDMQADMYLRINEKLENAGYRRYEISNFAYKGYESKHNLNYWNNNEYYGFGTAAHGYINGIRYSNSNDFNNIIRETEHKVTDKEMLEEEIFLGFRKGSGININTINKKFNIDFETKYQKVLNKYFPQYIEKTPCGYKLTLEGVLLSNCILAEFI